MRSNRFSLSFVLSGLAAVGLVAVVGSGCSSSPHARADGPSGEPAVRTVVTATDQKAMTPDQVLADLRAGNERFAAGVMMHRDLNAQVSATAQGQHPKAIVLGCVDSRVPIEMVFDQGVGDVFAARVAGNFVNADILGSMEFATKVAGSKLVVVMGHTACGAVKGACDNVDLGNVTSLVKAIEPSVKAVSEKHGKSCSSDNAEIVDDVASHNVARTIDDIRERSEILRTLEQQGAIKIVGGMYDLATGKVTFMNP